VKIRRYLRNKYAISLIIFVVYTLFLDDVDIFVIIRQNNKLSRLVAQQEGMSKQLEETKTQLLELNTLDGLERYAREKKLFKKDNEDIFVISYE